MNIGHITGGTHAGWRKTYEKPKDWLCSCGSSPLTRDMKLNPGYLVKCSCGNPRPS